ncbi:MAG: hypothetical protein MJE66_02315 [Proteobacteria bacterium]|nr:hypothetical protein [Pseudomonadota bacterium]
MRLRTRRSALSLAAPVLAITAALAHAEAPTPHGLPPRARPLFERLALADAAATAVVDTVSPGRLGLRDGQSLYGEVPRAFEIKRAPSAPPPVAEGDTVLAFLRGARSPYVLVDAPHEIIILSGARDGQATVDAVRRWSAAASDADQRRALLFDCLDSSDTSLQRDALLTLIDPGNGFLPFSDALLESEVARAAAPEATPARRRSAAILATASKAGATALTRALASATAPTPPEVVFVALQAAARYELDTTKPLVLAALSDPNAATRAAALRSLGSLLEDPDVRERIAGLAAGDPEPSVQAAAKRLGVRESRRIPTRP